MAYFQNPFQSEFRGSWVLGDRQYSPTFVCPPNTGRSPEFVVSWNEQSSFDIEGNDSDGNPNHILNIRMSIDSTFKHWVNLPIDLTRPDFDVAKMTPSMIVTVLNDDSNFSSYFTATLENSSSPNSNAKNRIGIRMKYETTRMKFFILNGQAEEILRFNGRAGIAELPSYFAKCKIWGGDMTEPNDETYSLVLLDPSNLGGSSSVDDNVIDNAVDNKGNLLGFDSSSAREDWELLAGRGSGLFKFKKITVDGDDRITETIEYPTGAKVGDLAKKTNYVYSGSNKTPDQITEIPYTLLSSDLVTP